MEGMQHPNSKRRTRTHPAPGWKIPNVMDLNPSINAQKLECLSDYWMLNLLPLFSILHLGPDNAVFEVKERWEKPTGQIAVFIDGRRENLAPMLPIPIRIVGSASEK
jgi:hypothetical protein